MMYCEYCDTKLADLAEARRHFLSVRHTRNKNVYELDMSKYFARQEQARLQPMNLVRLCEALNMYSEKDVSALERIDFFKMDRQWHFEVTEELHKVLLQSCIDHSLSKLLDPIRSELLEAISEEKAEEPNQA